MRALLLGFSIGFLSSIPPIGPGSLLLLRRGLEGRVSAGVAAAAGGAAADAIYCALAVVGFSYLFWKHPDIAASIRWVGVAILVLLGIWFLTKVPELPRPNGPNGVWDLYIKVDDIVAETAALEMAGVEIDRGPTKTEYEMIEIEVIDLVQNPKLARDDQILAIPT